MALHAQDSDIDAGRQDASATARSTEQRTGILSPRSRLFLAVTMLAFGAAHVVGIAKLQASHAAHATVPTLSTNLGD
jgi:hypothetical protein